jgi:hypothetical protein
MKVRLTIRKAGATLYEANREIVDARSFGEAFASVWTEMREKRLDRTTSVGDLMDAMGESELNELDGSEFVIRKI